MRDFGHADVLEPEVTGEPGQRTFRVLVMSGRESAALWLEKEQLAALALAIRQLLEQTSGGDTASDTLTVSPSWNAMASRVTTRPTEVALATLPKVTASFGARTWKTQSPGAGSVTP